MARNPASEVDKKERFALFIDNSNLFIEGQKYYAKKLNLIVPKDPCFRIDIGHLLEALMGNREIECGKLYGSEPPALDTVWKKIREHKLNVQTYQRNSQDKEKEVDTALSVDVAEFVCGKEDHRGTILLVAGDRDYCPVVKKVLEKGWNIEVAAFSVSITHKLTELQGSTPRSEERFKIRYLENTFDTQPRCYYVNRVFRSYRQNVKRRIPMPRSQTMVLELKSDVGTDLPTLKKIAEELTKIIRLPCRYGLNQKHDEEKKGIMTIFIIGTSPEITKEEQAEQEDIKKQRNFLQLCTELTQFEIEESIAKYIAKRKSTTSSRPNTKGFLDLWKKEQSGIEAKCREIFGTLPNCTTLMNYYKHEPDEPDQLELRNEFTSLIDSNSEVHIDDDDLASECDSDVDDNVDGNDDDWEGDACDLEGFTEVTKRHKKPKTYSDPCPFGFNCPKRLMCGYTHSPKEKEFFDKMPKDKRVTVYKGILCSNKGTCTSMCTYYHSIEEARCYVCNDKSGEIGHAKSNCEKVKWVNDPKWQICPYSFSCRKGLGCGKRHTKEEDVFFSANEGHGSKLYKSKPCSYHHSPKTSCKHGTSNLAPMCTYYHSIKEARCYRCKRLGGNVGHTADQCQA